MTQNSKNPKAFDKECQILKTKSKVPNNMVKPVRRRLWKVSQMKDASLKKMTQFWDIFERCVISIQLRTFWRLLIPFSKTSVLFYYFRFLLDKGRFFFQKLFCLIVIDG